MNVYQFKAGSHIAGDAQKVGERLETLRDRFDGLTPDVVVQDAREKDSALHALFEWDDKKAAAKHRLEQAGHILRCITVVFTEGESEERTFRAFVPVQKVSGERIYETTAKAMSDSDYRRQVLEQAYSELSAIGKKYKELRELSGVFQALDQIAMQLREPTRA